jgi:hypothetical protein
MNLVDYHRLRSKEKESWDLAALESAARAPDTTFPERVQRLLPAPEERFVEKLPTAERGPLFEKLAGLCQLYLDGATAQRTYLRSRIDRKIAGLLDSFGIRMAVFGLRERSAAMLRLSLIAFAIDDLASGDVREVLMSITVPFNAAKLVGMDPAALFREVAEISGPAFSAVAIDFANRNPGLQTLECMGWHQVETPDGVSFQFGWPKLKR